MRRVSALAPLATLVVLLVAAIGASSARAGEAGWRSLTPAPEPREEVSFAAFGHSIFLAGGNDLSQDRYDPATGRWTPVVSMPPFYAGLDHVNGVAIDHGIVYAGGLERWEFPFPVEDEVTTYDPIAESFASEADMPSPRAAGGVAAWRGRLIYAGGLGPEGSVSQVYAYDPRSDEWTRLEDMPRARDHFQAVVVGNELYAVGGRRTYESSDGIGIEDIATVDVLDLPANGNLATARWRSGVTALPTPRGGLGVAAVGDCIYTTGGELSTAGSAGVTGATESYDTVGGEWRELPPLPIPRHGIQAATVGNTIYVAGGGTESFAYSPTAAADSLRARGSAPCIATPPQSDTAVDTSPGPSEPAGEARPQVERLVVRPTRIRLRGGPPKGRGPVIVIFLSQPARVSLRVPGRFAFSRRLPAGRTVLPLPTLSHGLPLPPGRYGLQATVGAGGSSARASFRVVG